MRLSQSFGKTLRQAPADAELASHQLLIRAGYIRPVAAGIVSYLPLGQRVLRRLERIVADEMERIGGQALALPNLHPAALWQATGRWASFDVLFKVAAGGERDYALSPTHEEIVAALCAQEIDSYRDLPRLVYHISRKFRDEARPRGGLIRLREFLMKDAYSLDPDDAALDAFYPHVLDAYRRIFDRCEVPAVLVRADVGAMGGRSSHEFVVPHSQGEDTFLACGTCDYAANVEAATFRREGAPPPVLAPLERVPTPGCQTIADVAAYVGVSTAQTIKAVFYWGEAAAPAGRLVFALVRGDLEVNEVRLARVLGGLALRPATEAEIRSAGAEPGYASPIGLDVATGEDAPGILVVADPSLRAGGNFVVGANEDGFHYAGANMVRDVAVTLEADIAQAEAGHPCPECGGLLRAVRAIEVGHCFKLGTRFGEALGATYLDEANQSRPITMGSYGIGLDRLMAVIAEQHHDADGLVWPAAVAPHAVNLLTLGKGEDVAAAGDRLYAALRAAGIDTLYDDRAVSAGVKFKDADLIGVPLRLALGARGLAAGMVELKRRDATEREDLPLADAVTHLRALLANPGAPADPA